MYAFFNMMIKKEPRNKMSKALNRKVLNNFDEPIKSSGLLDLSDILKTNYEDFIYNIQTPELLVRKTQLMPVYIFDYQSAKLKSFQSNKTVGETVNALVALLKKLGIRVVTRIDYLKEAVKTGKKLRPTQLLFFDNPRISTTLIKDDQRVALDLPFKIVVWEDRKGLVWISFKQPVYEFENYNLINMSESAEKIDDLMRTVTARASF